MVVMVARLMATKFNANNSGEYVASCIKSLLLKF